MAAAAAPSGSAEEPTATTNVTKGTAKDQQSNGGGDSSVGEGSTKNPQQMTNAEFQRRYKRVEKAKDQTPEDEIRVTFAGTISSYITYAAKVFQSGKTSVTIRGTGRAMSNAVQTAEVLKRRIKGLHQITTMGCQEVTDEWEPLEDDLEKVTQKRTVYHLTIKLTQDDPGAEKEAVGYQAPLDESLVKETSFEEMRREAPRGGRGGGGRGGGRGGYGMGGGRGGGGRGGYYGGRGRGGYIPNGYRGGRGGGGDRGRVGGGRGRGGRGGGRGGGGGGGGPNAAPGGGV